MANRNTFSFEHNGTPMNVDVYGNFDPNNANTSFDKAIVVQHGSGRTADGYANYILDSAKLHGEEPGTYGVVAIDFSISGEQRSQEPYWTSGGWKVGDLSPSSAYGPRISSFTVMDKLLEDMAENWQGLEEVIVTGHSAGGQFVNRYAAGGDFSPLDDAGINYKVVDANPSSRMYFDEDIPYRYGTDNLNNYMTNSGGHAGLIDQMEKMDYAIFAGTADNYNEGDLDTSARGMAQGANRWERSVNYETHLDQTFGDLPNHYFVDAPGVGHSGGGMYRSEAGQELLYGDWDMA